MCPKWLISTNRQRPKQAANTQQFIGMAKAATSVMLKKGQAFFAIREKSNCTIEAQIGCQYFWLPTLFDSSLL
jgi:hypothetical protein